MNSLNTRLSTLPTGGLLTRSLLTLLAASIYAAAVHWLWGWQPLLEPWRQVGPPYLLGALSLMMVSYLLRAARLLDFFALLDRRHLLQGLKLVLWHNLFNTLLPMRSGELSFPVLMATYFKVGPGRSLPALMWMRVLDLHTVAALALAAAVPRAGAAALVSLLLWLLTAPLAYPLRGYVLAWIGERDGKPARLLRLVFEGLPESWGGVVRIWAWTWVNWVLKLAVLAWVLGQFIEVPTAVAWWGAIGGDLTSVLPVHAPAGFGTYEAGVVAGLVPWGVAAEPALQAAVNLHLFLLLGMVVGGVVALLLPGRREGDDKRR